MKIRILVVLVGIWIGMISVSAFGEDVKYAQSIVVAQDGSGDYTTINEALKKLKGDSEDPVRVYIKNGKYDEKILMNYTLNNVTLEGESRKGVVISHGDYAQLNNMGTSGSYTLRVDGNNITLKNLTIENTAGPVGQAVALHTTGDKIRVIDCDILGNQDTLYATGRNSRDLFDNCYIEGTVDFIFGAATALFRNCHIHAKSDSYLTAASTAKENPVGYVFHNCKVTAAPDVKDVHLGRTWRPYASTHFIECELPEAINPKGWHNWGKEENEKTARYGEYKCTGPGAKDDERVGWRKKLSALEAAELTNPAQLFTRESTWIPD
ncbi:MAG: pectin esterase [Muribaculaceae bacterium]|nr:pectin esterase [Muribaculaceae bacterium]